MTGTPLCRTQRIRGCLLAGACGDALGAPVEFLRLDQIRCRYGPAGIADFDLAYGRVGAITDDTQMTLFTAEGLIEAMREGSPDPAPAVHRAYLRWLVTQDERPTGVPVEPHAGGLLELRPLWSRRAPGNTCLDALRRTGSLGSTAVNNSKGCGGVMRVAPAGLIGSSFGHPFELGSRLAHLTHGHPSGYLAAGHLAATLTAILGGADLQVALTQADAGMAGRPEAAEVEDALAAARRLARKGRRQVVPGELGQGWVAEEALAIAVWCALVGHDTADAIRLAVNHDGDSDSTGSIAGHLVGALHGPAALPQHWLDQLELRAEIEQLAVELAATAAGCQRG
jgi:ADP-ribosylglycohydrolase